MGFWFNLLKNNLFLAGGDHTYWMADGDFWLQKIYAWQSFEGPGEPNNSISQFLFFLLLKLGEYLQLSRGAAQFIILSTLLILAGYSFYLFYGELKKVFSIDIKYRIDGVLAAILYVLHPFDLNILQLEKLIASAALPLCMYLIIKSYRLKTLFYVYIAVFLTVAFSPMAINLAVYASVFAFIFIGIILLGLVQHNLKQALWYFAVFAAFSFLLNLWWILPTFYSILFSSSSSIKFLQSTNFLSSVGLSDLYRLIPTWAWRAGHNNQPYYPYAAHYDQGLLFVLSSLFIFVPLSFGIIKAYKSKYKRIYIYTLAVIFLSLFLAKGANPPFGNIYQFLFTYVPMFSIFREPSAKFILGYKLHLMVLFGFFIHYILNKFGNKQYKNLMIGLFIASILFVSMPTIRGDIVGNSWNGSMRSWAVKIPPYWQDYENYLAAKPDINNESSMLTYPATGYGSAYNWPKGFNGTDVNKFFTGKRIIDYYSFSIDEKSKAVNLLYPRNLNTPIPKNVWGLFNIEYLTQQNDFDWRYSSMPASNPTEVSVFISKQPFQFEKSFGFFDPDYLEYKITNDETNSSKKYSLYTELTNKPAINLYKIEPGSYLEKIYVPKVTVAAEDQNLIEAAFLYEDNKDFVMLPLEGQFESNKVLLSGLSIAPLVNQSQTWNSGWVWPDVNSDPQSIKYKLVRLKETYDLKNSDLTELEKSELYLWLAAKRLSEIKNYNISDKLRDSLLKDYLANMSKSMSILLDIPVVQRNEDFYEISNKIFTYLKFSNEYVGFDIKKSSSTDNYLSFENIRENLFQEINTNCTGLCYRFEVDNQGEYEVYAYADRIKKLENFYDYVNVRSGESNFEVNLKELDKQDRFIKLGSLNLKSGINYVDTDINFREEELIDAAKWSDSSNVSAKNNTIGDINFYSHSFPIEVFGVQEPMLDDLSLIEFSLKEQYIPAWQKNNEYILSFDYEVDNSVFGVFIAENNSGKELEDVGDYRNILADEKAEIFSRNFGVKGSPRPACDQNFTDKCMVHFEAVVKAGDVASGAVVYLYSYTKNSWGSAKISNFSITRKRTLKLFLVKDINSVEAENTVIASKKINPTKYIAEVKNVEKKHFIVFSESFNKGWNAYILKDGQKFKLDKVDHLKANGYANAWRIDPSKHNINGSYSLIIEYYPQYLLYLGVGLFFLTLVFMILFYYRIFGMRRFSYHSIKIKNFSGVYALSITKVLDKYSLNLMGICILFVFIINLRGEEIDLYREVNLYLLTSVIALVFYHYKIKLRTIGYFTILLLSLYLISWLFGLYYISKGFAIVSFILLIIYMLIIFFKETRR